MGATGINAFPALFNPVAVGRNDANAYLLAYLSTAIYPDRLPEISLTMHRDLNARAMNTNPMFFQQEFTLATAHLFWNPAAARSDRNRPAEFAFVQSDDTTGYDPEVMLINTTQAVIVVFRGTDRVGSVRDASGYQWNEWIKTDFDFNLIRPEPNHNIPGRVHQGFWNSLAKIREELVRKITAYGGGAGKPIWITGHSLGAAQAQLFGAYLVRAKNMPVQGVYAFAAPHVGDREFRDDINRAIPPQRMQRFEFINDTVTMMPPYAADYQRAGTRNYYNDVRTYQFAKEERWFTDDLLFLPTLFGTLGNHVEGSRNSVSDDAMRSSLIRTPVHLNLLGSDFCYHQPTWYLNAAYNQLPPAAQNAAPNPLAMPTPASEACSITNVALAKSNNPATLVGAGLQSAAQGAQQAATELVHDISFTASVVADNANGRAIAEGTYVFLLNRGGMALRHTLPAANGSFLQLAPKSPGAVEQQWEVKRDGLVGYTIKASGRFMDNAHESEATDNGKVQLWEANMPFGGHQGNQQWSFIKVGTNAYVIRSNSVFGHVLSAVSGETSNGGVVGHAPTVPNSPLQVWIAERVR